MLCAARAADRAADPVLLGRSGTASAAPRPGPHRGAAGQPRGEHRRRRGRDRRRRPAGELRLGERAAVESICPQRRRLGLDPQARRGADRGDGRAPGRLLAAERRRDRRRVGRLPRAPHELALVGRGRRDADGRAARLEPGRGRQRPAERRASAASGSTACRASRGRSPSTADAVALRRRLAARLRRRERATPATTTTCCCAPATATASAASAAPSKGSSWPPGLGRDGDARRALVSAVAPGGSTQPLASAASASRRPAKNSIAAAPWSPAASSSE